jgi:hypothetical protein
MLFKDTNKLQEFAEITTSMNFASIKTTIDRIESNHIVPVLGATLYASLNTAYTNAAAESSLTTAQKNLLEKCRKVIGPLLGYYYAPLGELKFSDAGLRREETASSKTAFQYQVTNFREASLRNGETATELLYEFLETNKADYSEWTSSDAFKSYRSLFIKSGKEFNELFPSHSPYRNYYAMRSKMQDVEEQNIRAAIGDATFNALKTKDRATTPGFTDKETELIFKLKKAIANFTVSFAIPFLAVRIDANGITVNNSGPRTSRDEDAMRSNAADNNISNIITAANDTGTTWLKDAIKYLNDNAADFATWTAETTTTSTDNNPDLNGSFIFL